ncbi:MAG: Trm112 family protein [Phycisphaerae bacterium]
MIDDKLLDILVCPACRTKVVREGDRLICQNPSCGLRYPIRDDIPVMLVEEAEKPGDAEPTGEAS